MAYKPYDAIKSIYDLKKQWEEANNAGDSIGANAAAQNAKKYYESLKNNGYGQVADELSKVNYEGAKKIHDTYATEGKTAIRPFFENLAKANNISSDEVNNLIKYNNTTGRVSFAGTDIGKPDAAVDGVSYWEEDYLKGIWDNYMKNMGDNSNGVKGNANYSERIKAATDKNDEEWKQLNVYNDDYTSKSTEAWGVANTPATQSQEVKDMLEILLPNFVVQGNKSLHNTVASNAASNGGNVDSFAAANGVRQRNAQVLQGVQAAYQLGMDAFNTRMNNINNLLSSMGVHRESLTNQQNANIERDMTIAQQAFDNAETQRINTHTINEDSKNNQVAREDVYSTITGKVSPYVKYRELYDENGNLKYDLDNTDFSALISDIDKKIKSVTTSEEKAQLEATKQILREIRTIKIMNDLEKYGQYSTDLAFSNTPTAEYDFANRPLAQESTVQTKKIENPAEVEYAIVPYIEGTIDKSSSDEEERNHLIKGYSGINNLSARFINEVLLDSDKGYAKAYNGQAIIEEDDVLNAINDRSDAYGLTLADAEAILELLGFYSAKDKLKQREKGSNYEGQPGVARTE